MKGNKLVKNKLEIIKDGDKMKYAIIDWSEVEVKFCCNKKSHYSEKPPDIDL